MDDSQFWWDLEPQFRELDEEGVLWASVERRKHAGLRSPVTRCDIEGGDDVALRLRFEKLARQTGDALDPESIEDSLTEWLEAIRRHETEVVTPGTLVWILRPKRVRRIPQTDHIGLIRPADRTQFAYHMHRVCEASANFCLYLGNHAIEERRLGKLRVWYKAGLISIPELDEKKKNIDTSVDRVAIIQTYIDEVLRETGKRITQRDIWKAAGDKTRTEFDRWKSRFYERRGKKRNEAAHKGYLRVLTEKPHLRISHTSTRISPPPSDVAPR